MHLFLAVGSLLMTIYHHAAKISKKGSALLLSSHTREGAHNIREMGGRDEEADGFRGLAYDPLSTTPVYRELLHENPNRSFLMGIGSSSNNY